MAPPHWIGRTDDGREVYQFIEGWIPVREDNRPAIVDCDGDGNWVVNPDQPDDICPYSGDSLHGCICEHCTRSTDDE